jgi:hypothetical protein
MPEIETPEEMQAEQLAYDAWVAVARGNGHNGERDIFRAGWLAGREYSSTETQG